ncbi:hypothetical protein [Novipirellula caenicola]|uniref:Uncharacterized protein n=1 Tax=Novipirellula caenicola TaxID=1536901 RepID=A0ABP9VVG9_9BACT
MSQTRLFAIVLILFSFVSSAPLSAEAGSPTGWSPIILPTGTYRAQIKSMPIHQRPGRPLHVYGNTIRLMEQSKMTGGFHRPLRQILFGTNDLMGTLSNR